MPPRYILSSQNEQLTSIPPGNQVKGLIAS